jgi:hypothetical protein
MAVTTLSILARDGNSYVVPVASTVKAQLDDHRLRVAAFPASGSIVAGTAYFNTQTGIWGFGVASDKVVSYVVDVGTPPVLGVMDGDTNLVNSTTRIATLPTNLERTGNKDTGDMPATPVSGHYVSTGTAKTYIDTSVSSLNSTLRTYISDQIALCTKLVSLKATIEDDAEYDSADYPSVLAVRAYVLAGLLDKEVISNRVSLVWGESVTDPDAYPTAQSVQGYVSSGLALKENLTNKVFEITSASTDDEYPSAYGVYSFVSTGLDLKENLSNKSTSMTTDKDSTDKYPSVKLVKDYIDGADLLKEDTANKSSSMTTDADSIIKFPVVKAVSDYVTSAISGKEDSSNKKTMAWGTAITNVNFYPSIPSLQTYISDGLALRELLSNKSTSMATDASSTSKYPSVKLVKDYIDTADGKKEDTSNKVVSFEGTVTDVQYPSAKLTKDYVDDRISEVATRGEILAGVFYGKISASTAWPTEQSWWAGTTATINGFVFATGQLYNYNKTSKTWSVAATYTPRDSSRVLVTEEFLDGGGTMQGYAGEGVYTQPAGTAGSWIYNPDKQRQPDGVTIVLTSSGAFGVADGGITAAKMAADAINTVNIVNLAVTDAKLAADSVLTAKIKDGNVTQAKLASDSVSTVKIVNLAVTNAKLAQMPAKTFKGNYSTSQAAADDLTVTEAAIMLANDGDATNLQPRYTGTTSISSTMANLQTTLNKLSGQTWTDRVTITISDAANYATEETAYQVTSSNGIIVPSLGGLLIISFGGAYLTGVTGVSYGNGIFVNQSTSLVELSTATFKVITNNPIISTMRPQGKFVLVNCAFISSAVLTGGSSWFKTHFEGVSWEFTYTDASVALRAFVYTSTSTTFSGALFGSSEGHSFVNFNGAFRPTFTFPINIPLVTSSDSGSLTISGFYPSMGGAGSLAWPATDRQVSFLGEWARARTTTSSTALPVLLSDANQTTGIRYAAGLKYTPSTGSLEVSGVVKSKKGLLLENLNNLKGSNTTLGATLFSVLAPVAGTWYSADFIIGGLASGAFTDLPSGFGSTGMYCHVDAIGDGITASLRVYNAPKNIQISNSVSSATGFTSWIRYNQSDTLNTPTTGPAIDDTDAMASQAQVYGTTTMVTTGISVDPNSLQIIAGYVKQATWVLTPVSNLTQAQIDSMSENWPFSITPVTPGGQNNLSIVLNAYSYRNGGKIGSQRVRVEGYALNIVDKLTGVVITSGSTQIFVEYERSIDDANGVRNARQWVIKSYGSGRFIAGSPFSIPTTTALTLTCAKDEGMSDADYATKLQTLINNLSVYEINRQVNINISGTYASSTALTVTGLKGSGILNLNFQQGATFTGGNISIRNCNVRVYVQGASGKLVTINSSSAGCVFAHTVKGVYLNYVAFAPTASHLLAVNNGSIEIAHATFITGTFQFDTAYVEITDSTGTSATISVVTSGSGGTLMGERPTGSTYTHNDKIVASVGWENPVIASKQIGVAQLADEVYAKNAATATSLTDGTPGYMTAVMAQKLWGIKVDSTLGKPNLFNYYTSSPTRLATDVYFERTSTVFGVSSGGTSGIATYTFGSTTSNSITRLFGRINETTTHYGVMNSDLVGVGAGNILAVKSGASDANASQLVQANNMAQSISGQWTFTTAPIVPDQALPS